MNQLNDVQILINKYRAHYGLSQVKLARRLNVNQSQLCKWEGGKLYPSSLRVRELKRRLKIDEREPVI